LTAIQYFRIVDLLAVYDGFVERARCCTEGHGTEWINTANWLICAFQITRFTQAVFALAIVLTVSLILSCEFFIFLPVFVKVGRYVTVFQFIDHYTAIIVGSSWLAFPELLLRKQILLPVDESHMFVGRMFGCLLLSSCVFSNHSTYFRYRKDRNIWLSGRVMICVGVLLSQLYSQYAYLKWWNSSHWAGILLNAVWLSCSLLGLTFMYEKETKKD
uniref:Conserved plasma membrane protein n=1 Tax=Soboliphyme baturini TaxID=241478 RepID=A0A183IXY7_9BILA